MSQVRHRRGIQLGTEPGPMQAAVVTQLAPCRLQLSRSWAWGQGAVLHPTELWCGGHLAGGILLLPFPCQAGRPPGCALIPSSSLLPGTSACAYGVFYRARQRPRPGAAAIVEG